MKTTLPHISPFVLLAVFLFCCYPSQLVAAEKTMLIGSGNLTGVYYSASSAVVKMHNKKRKEYGVWLVNDETDGSVENIGKVVTQQIDFGIAQSNTLYYAWQGQGDWKGEAKNELRAVMGLYIEDITLIASEESEIVRPLDLRGKRVNIGPSNDTVRMLLHELGLDPDTDVDLLEEDSYLSAELLQAGDIDAYFYTVGHPNLSIYEAIGGEQKVRIVAFENDFIEKADVAHPFLMSSEIEIDAYRELLNEISVPTLGVKAILFTHQETDEEVVYRVVKQVMENFDLFRRQHPAFANLTPQKMANKTILPLHPGAERYFREAGIIP